MRFENVLEAVGRTPLIRLNRMAEGLKPRIYAKCEFMNPGGSVKDRIGAAMIDDAERRGLLKPGGTIIEGTSGNTGIGLALVAALRGYKLIFTITDKQSREKINLLKALGAEVIVCPTAVEPEDPRSYYSVAKKLAREIPNAFYPNQYENPRNPAAHYATTGPEIWEDTDGRVTHFVAGMGTGGTISGAGRFLKEKNPRIKIVGADPVGSLYYEKIKFGRLGKARPYVVEGIGEDIFPPTMDLGIVDDVVQTPDMDCFVTTRRLARLEGLLTGGSGGAAVWAGLKYAERLGSKDLMVVLLPDTGMRYLSKIYNDEWMRENQYLETELRLRAKDVMAAKRRARRRKGLLMSRPRETLLEALGRMRRQDISQLPVFENGKLVGAVYEDDILALLLKGRQLGKMIVREVMAAAPPVITPEARIEAILRLVCAEKPAVLVRTGRSTYDIITKYDILNAVAKENGGAAAGRRN
ncbi:MAG: pyridoxal-phosphate dependent enzyme [Elusimicrobia bacterium]|nr:pyridoxal-phosphate dependent enzyme [Elusimicrobiota bacterium]MDE2426567.1 pyridoxal-phosphate dependent enzyme [Elusimicrobiota bacterium]